MATLDSPWFLYVLLCENNHLYTGIAKNVEKRFLAHQQGKGAKYTRANRPIKIVYQLLCENHSEALKAEYQFKKLSAAEKRERCGLEK